MSKLAIYPGTFDPITNGHLDILGRAASLFDNVILAVGTNSQKSPLFSETERVALAEQAIGEALPRVSNVSVDTFDGLLVKYAESKKAVAVVRGLRVLSDFEYEFQMALMNRKLAEQISTVFLMPHEQYTYLNSTIVRELARYGEAMESFVPANVSQALREKFSR